MLIAILVLTTPPAAQAGEIKRKLLEFTHYLLEPFRIIGQATFTGAEIIQEYIAKIHQRDFDRDYNLKKVKEAAEEEKKAAEEAEAKAAAEAEQVKE